MDTDYLDHARQLGRDAARAAASWATDGNTDADHARRLLAMLDAGDPAADDHLPARPDLSGQWADGPMPLSLAREVLGDDDPTSDDIDAIAEAFEEGVDEAFEPACEAQLRAFLGDDDAAIED